MIDHSIDLPAFAEQAACVGKAPALWDVIPGGPWDEGVAICWAVCPVRLQCLAYAMRMEHGPRTARAMVFGGYTPRQRERIARKGRAGPANDFVTGNPAATPKTCRECGRSLRKSHQPADGGSVRHYGRGLCFTCWRDERRGAA